MKIGILTDSSALPAWKYKIIKDLCQAESNELTIIKTKFGGLRKTADLIKKLNSGLFYLYEKADYLIFGKTDKFKEIKNEKDALKEFKINESKYNIIEYNAEKDYFFSPEDLYFEEEEINFDVIIDLTKTLKKDFYNNLSKYSKKGICYFEFGDDSGLYPPFFNEIYLNKATINTYLCITDGKHKTDLYKSCSGIYNFSLYLNSTKNLWKTSDFINRKINEINSSTYDFDTAKNIFRRNLKAPSNFVMIKFIPAVLKNIFKLKFAKSKDQWFLAYKKIQKTTDFISEDESNYNMITPPENKFFADPFIIDENDKSYVFFEDYCCSKQKGVISYLEINERGESSEPKIVLEKDFHLSYPFVFNYEDKYYMIPETLGNGTIELYEATNFPEKWELKKILFENINAVDTSLFIYNKKFWLFTNLSKDGGSLSDELYIFHSDSLFGDWQPHSKNPVLSDVKSARSAGKLFFSGNELIRPSQKSTLRYGYALNFNKVDILTENDYKETLIKTVKPEFIKDNLAIHTYNCDNRYKIIDGMRLIKK